jgi:hypothetical protein
MSRNGVWAEGPIIEATVLCYGLRLNIIDFRTNEEPRFIEINGGDTLKPFLTLFRIGEDIKCQHYGVFVVRQASESFESRAKKPNKI